MNRVKDEELKRKTPLCARPHVVQLVIVAVLVGHDPLLRAIVKNLERGKHRDRASFLLPSTTSCSLLNLSLSLNNRHSLTLMKRAEKYSQRVHIKTKIQIKKIPQLRVKIRHRARSACFPQGGSHSPLPPCRLAWLLQKKKVEEPGGKLSFISTSTRSPTDLWLMNRKNRGWIHHEIEKTFYIDSTVEFPGRIYSPRGNPTHFLSKLKSLEL